MSSIRGTPRWLIAAAAGTAIFVIAAMLFLAVRPRRARISKPAATELGGVVTVPIADLKSEASPRAAAVGALPKGTRVTIVADRGQWLEIRTPKGSTAFIAAESVETDAERQTREERAKRILSFTPVPGLVAEDTDVLLGAFPSAPKAGRLRQGTAVPIYAVDHDYYAVKDGDGGIAFIHSAAVDLVPPDPRLPAIVPASGKMIKDVAVNDLAPPAPPTPPAESSPREAGSEGETVVLEEPIEPAALISKVDPSYPEAARRAGVEGTVVLDAEVSATGEVVSVKVERGLPLGVSEAAVAAVHQWRYRPARGRTGPVASHKTVRIQFTLGG